MRRGRRCTARSPLSPLGDAERVLRAVAGTAGCAANARTARGRARLRAHRGDARVTPDEAFEALQRGAAPARIPVATYRLQLSPSLTFDDAAQLVSYLDRLGITDCYT